MQQLAPYIGKMKSGMARALILAFSKEGDLVLDPFSGSGVAPFEAALLQRHAIANDLNPYAHVLTLGKFTAPTTIDEAISRAEGYLSRAERIATRITAESIPNWVRSFFHPKTLRETVALSRLLRAKKEYFLLSCLLGILHHVRPGFLSYPSSHLVPYLRLKKYPKEDFPGMYAYRDVRSRLLAKIERAYARHTPLDPQIRWSVMRENAMCLGLKPCSVDCIVSSPPYFGALDYGRDNRLRLWFLGMNDYKTLECKLTAEDRVYIPQMRRALAEMGRVLKVDGHCILVLGNYSRNGSSKDSAKTIQEITSTQLPGVFSAENVIVDPIPDERRTRRRTKTTTHETILVFRKAGELPH